MVNTHRGRTTVSLLACIGSIALGAAGATAVRVFADHEHDHADEPLVRTKPNATPLGKIHLYLCAFYSR
jgi:hypothetical protein